MNSHWLKALFVTLPDFVKCNWAANPSGCFFSTALCWPCLHVETPDKKFNVHQCRYLARTSNMYLNTLYVPSEGECKTWSSFELISTQLDWFLQSSRRLTNSVWYHPFIWQLNHVCPRKLCAILHSKKHFWEHNLANISRAQYISTRKASQDTNWSNLVRNCKLLSPNYLYVYTKFAWFLGRCFIKASHVCKLFKQLGFERGYKILVFSLWKHTHMLT